MRIVGELESRGVAFESITERIETGSVAGKLIFHVFASLAEFERNLICERTHAGLVARKSLVLGVQHYSRADLEAVQSGSQKRQIQVWAWPASMPTCRRNWLWPQSNHWLQKMARTMRPSLFLDPGGVSTA